MRVGFVARSCMDDLEDFRLIREILRHFILRYRLVLIGIVNFWIASVSFSADRNRVGPSSN